MSEAIGNIRDVSVFYEVLPGSHEMPQPPRFTFGDFPAGIAARYYAAMSLSPMGVHVGAGFSLGDRTQLRHRDRPVIAADLKLFPKHIEQLDPQAEVTLDRRHRRRVAGRAAVIVSPGYTIYGHWMADILPRLAVLEAAGCDLRALTYPVPDDTPGWGLALLHLAGIPRQRILPFGSDEMVDLDEALMPTLIHNGGRYSPLLGRFAALLRRGLRQAGHDLKDSGAPRRIFVVRRRGNRKLTNRARIEEMAAKSGFTLVSPETLGLPEQFALFANVEVIAGEYGSGLHNSVLARPGTVVCALRGSLHHPGFLQSAMGEALDHPTGYVFGQSGTGGEPDDFTVQEQDFAECLRLAFGPHANLKQNETRQPV